ncbi:MAG: dienelactone hydrolase family protein [Gammaproteobacteria bacterium]|nr:dienelactone hydrolase family protein [Gammaproteobacteria bacterium]MDH4255263.1 dienelactone hydrolase family protein [Gammaproteobacteria bacterium]MDH5309995.1 dienelactone hydrolase family protein [Gammaproteobacteria bacterium]
MSQRRIPVGQVDRRILDLFDGYVHGTINRRQFIDRAASVTASSVAAAALLDALSPNYALAQQVDPADPAIEVGYRHYGSPQGAGDMRGYFATPIGAGSRFPGVVVVHENRGLNPYIEDVARRLAKAGFVAFAPDALTPLGGYPGNDDQGRELQRQRDRDEMLQDFVAAVSFLQGHERSTGRVGCVGFCYGGGVCNELAVRVPDLAASVPYYGRQPDPADVPRIAAALLIHYAEFDDRVNEGWPAYKAALDASGKAYTAHFYPGTNHGFHNDTTPRYDRDAAELSWQRTIEFFGVKLV